MKKIISLSLTLFIIHTFIIYAQPCGAHFAAVGTCEDSIPEVAIVVSSDLTVGATVNQCYWVCSGVTLSISSISSGNLNIDMEAGSTLNFSGNESTIWAKEGCTINIGSCMPIIIISMEPDVDVNFDAGGAGCIMMDTCENIIFNYSEAPAGGCVVGIVENNFAADQFSIYPNPAKNSASLEFMHAITNETNLIMCDMQGNIVLRKILPASNSKMVSLQIPDLATGIYRISIGDTMHKLIVVE